MANVKSIFEEATPLDAVWNAIIEKNPGLAKYGKDSFTVLKIFPATGSRNTEVRMVGNGNVGIEGIMSAFYDRADLGKLNKTFGARKPTINVALAQGTVLTYASLLPQINALLGYNLTLDGKWPDIQAGSVTVPARGGKVSFTLQSVPSASGGFYPASARTLPGTSLSIDLVNRGQTINNGAPNRSINPFVKADGNLNWTGETVSADKTKTLKSLLVKIYNVDFSDLVNEVTERSNIYQWGLAPDRTHWIWYIRQALADGIKKRCQDLDIPIIDIGNPAKQSGWSLELQAQLPTHAYKFYDSIFRTVSSLGAAPWANPRFTKCILTADSFKNIYGFPVAGQYQPRPGSVEAKEGWATSLANYPINYNLP